jgi:hypothetical protein
MWAGRSLPFATLVFALVSAIAGNSAPAAEKLSVPPPVPRPKAEAPVIAPSKHRAAGPERSEQPTQAVPPALPGPAAPERGADAAAVVGCLLGLAEAKVTFRPATVETDREECRPAAVIRVTTVGGESTVKLSAPTILGCPVASAFAAWLKESVIPAAVENLSEAPTQVLVGAGYECRTRNWQAGAPLSEHATANAIDIMGFAFSGKRTVQVLEHWDQETPAGAFLSAIHTDACRHFTTVLGPRADEAHKNHFHLDLKSRGKSKHRLCQ